MGEIKKKKPLSFKIRKKGQFVKEKEKQALWREQYPQF